MDNAHALVVCRPTEDEFAETVLYQPLFCRRQDLRKLKREVQAMLRKVGFQRTFLDISFDTPSPSDPDPVLFGEVADGAGPHVRRISVLFGYGNEEFVSTYHYNRQQYRVLRDALRLILERVGIHVRSIRYG